MNDRSYAKLFSTIVTSSMWCEDSDTRIVWVTMLALCNEYGEVSAALPGLARTANVTLEKCAAAVACFEAPDPHSRTTDNEGRRIEKISGGWRLLNYETYRKVMSSEERKEYKRRHESERRARKRGQRVDIHGQNVDSGGQNRADGDGDGDGKAKGDGEEEKTSPSSGKPDRIEDSTMARAILHWLNERAGKHFRETGDNLKIITARFVEVDRDMPGIKQMIDRQCARWKGTDQAEYLRPSTLFRPSKFNDYYDQRELPVVNPVNGKFGNNGNGNHSKPDYSNGF